MVKFYDRVDQIYRQKLPPSLAGARYGTHGVSVMGYVGQFMPPPRNFMAIELATASKVLHMATNALDTSAVFSLELVGGPKLVRPLHFLFSALVRASVKTFKEADAQVLELRKAALLGNTVAEAANPQERLIPQGWDCEPFCLIH